eukprot:g13383.t1
MRNLWELWLVQGQQREKFYHVNEAWWVEGYEGRATPEGAMIGDDGSEEDLRHSEALLQTALEGLPRPGSALDLGSGLGRVTKQLLLKVVTGRAKWLKTAKAYLGEEAASRCAFIHSKLEAYEPDDMWDLIWIQWTLQYLIDQDVENRPVYSREECFQMDTPGKEGRFDVTRPIAHLRVLVELAKLQVRHLETWDECSCWVLSPSETGPSAYKLGDLQWCMVHVPDSVLTVKDFAGHAARLLELNLHGGNAEPPQILLDGFLVPHDEEVREVLRDDEVIDVEPAEPGQASGLSLPKRGHEALETAPAKRPKVAPAVMALGWQAPSPDAKKAAANEAKAKANSASMVNGHSEQSKASRAMTSAKALALATCESMASSAKAPEEGRGIFVGGLPPSVDDRELRKHFESYGEVQDATVVMNQRTGKSKGFGFVEFQQHGVREKVMEEVVEIHGKTVEVKVRQAKAKGGGLSCRKLLAFDLRLAQHDCINLQWSHSQTTWASFTATDYSTPTYPE